MYHIAVVFDLSMKLEEKSVDRYGERLEKIQFRDALLFYEQERQGWGETGKDSV